MNVILVMPICIFKVEDDEPPERIHHQPLPLQRPLPPTPPPRPTLRTSPSEINQRNKHEQGTAAPRYFALGYVQTTHTRTRTHTHTHTHTRARARAHAHACGTTILWLILILSASFSVLRAHRTCAADGTWSHGNWTNYSACMIDMPLEPVYTPQPDLHDDFVSDVGRLKDKWTTMGFSSFVCSWWLGMLEGGGKVEGGGRYSITKMDEPFPCIYLHARSYYLRRWRSPRPLYYTCYVSPVLVIPSIFFNLFFSTLPGTSVQGLYSKTPLHHYNISLAHSFTRLYD